MIEYSLENQRATGFLNSHVPDGPGEFRGLRGPRGPRGPEKKSAKSKVRGMNLIKVREIRSPRNEFLQKSAKSEISRNNLKCLRCAALPQASLAIYVFTYGEGAPAVGLAQCNNFGLQLWFFAFSLPTSDCPPRTLTYRPCGQAQHPLLVIRYRVAA